MLHSQPDFVVLDWNGTVVPFFGLPMYPGVADRIQVWKQVGIKIFVVSHAHQSEIAKDVARTKLPVDEVHGCNNKGPVVVDLCRRFGRGVLLGDHSMDFRAAQEADVPFYQAVFENQVRLSDGVQEFRSWEELATLLPFGGKVS